MHAGVGGFGPRMIAPAMSSTPNQAADSSDKGVFRQKSVPTRVLSDRGSSDKGVLSSSSMDTEVGKLAVEIGLVTRSEVDFCREQQKQASDPNTRSLTDLLVEHNFLTVNQAKRVRQVVVDGKSSRIFRVMN